MYYFIYKSLDDLAADHWFCRNSTEEGAEHCFNMLRPYYPETVVTFGNGNDTDRIVKYCNGVKDINNIDDPLNFDFPDDAFEINTI